MTHLIDKSVLVAEIQRRALKAGLHDGVIAETREDECYSILSFIDTLEVKDLQEEPVSEDLKEFEVEYIEREKDNIVCVYDRHAGLVDGAKWQKQQMMKDAIEAEIINWASMFTSIKAIEPGRAETMIKEKFDIGDKVKLIIVKED